MFDQQKVMRPRCVSGIPVSGFVQADAVLGAPFELMKKLLNELSLARAMELFVYDSESGIIKNRIARGKGGYFRRGAVSGGPHNCGYIRIHADSQRYLAHRLAWLLFHGEWPDSEVDHINGNRSDNRISNLRKATVSEQRHNMRKTHRNTSGVKGVYWDKANLKWAADICCNGVRRHVGRFLRIEDAEKELNNIRIQLHGEFARHS